MNRFLLMEGVAAMQIPTMVWPAYSPDFNPIETIWSWMKLLSNVDWKLVSSNISRRFIKSWMHGRTVYRLAYEGRIATRNSISEFVVLKNGSGLF